MSNDPYAWLEDVTGAKPLDWVKTQNAKTEHPLIGLLVSRDIDDRIVETLTIERAGGRSALNASGFAVDGDAHLDPRSKKGMGNRSRAVKRVTV